MIATERDLTIGSNTMATPVNDLPIEIAQGELETRYIEMGEMASQILKQIDAIGNDLLWLGSAAAPTLRIARMTIAGS